MDRTRESPLCIVMEATLCAMQHPMCWLNGCLQHAVERGAGAAVEARKAMKCPQVTDIKLLLAKHDPGLLCLAMSVLFLGAVDDIALSCNSCRPSLGRYTDNDPVRCTDVLTLIASDVRADRSHWRGSKHQISD